MKKRLMMFILTFSKKDKMLTSFIKPDYKSDVIIILTTFMLLEQYIITRMVIR